MTEHHPQPGAKANTVAVIGAGVVGLCTALEAQRHGYQVTLFDRDTPGKGASFGNAGYLATELVAPLATPKAVAGALPMLLDPKGPLSLPWRYLHRSLPWLARFVSAARPAQVARGQQALSQLNQLAIAAWQQCLADIGASDMLVPSGYLLVWESETRLDEARHHADWLREQGIETELVQGERLAQLEPELAPALSHALYFDQACQVSDPWHLCQRLSAVFQARGGHFIQQPVERLEPGDNSVTVHSKGETFCFDQAVVCAGAWSGQLLAELGIKVPLEAERGYHLTYAADAVQLNHTIGSAERRMVMSALGSGIRVVGMTEFGGLTLAPLARGFKALQHHAQGLFPALAGPDVTASQWMGHRPTLPDSLPVIDRHPQYPGLFFTFGHQHLGLTQAAISAELVVSLMRQQTPKMETGAFRADRF